MKLFNVRRRLIKPPSGGLIAGLDIGSSKVSCAIARLNPSGIPELVGFGHQASRGLRNGAIVDMEALATSVAAAVHAAEKMAEETISEVCVCNSTNSHVTIPQFFQKRAKVLLLILFEASPSVYIHSVHTK